jgi:uncharacterized protein YjiS (DUF1127 family)
MRIQTYFDTFSATLFASNRNNTTVTVLIAVWNAPVVLCIVTLTTLYTWQPRSHMRSELGALDHWYLSDMGIDPLDAKREATKPFWRS